MPSTECLESFREFILIPIDRQIDEYGTQISLFINQLSFKVEYILGEARRNSEEYLTKSLDSTQFFKDMHSKILYTEDAIFFTNSDGVIYLPLGNLIDKYGDGIHLYTYHINKAIQDVKHCFETYLPTSSITSERETRIPSFNAVNKNASFEVFNELLKYGFISRININDFYAIFKGNLITTPIIWSGKISHLAYFIRNLENKGYIDSLDKEIWLVTQKCFVLNNNVPLSVKQLRHSDTPKSHKVLDKIISLFSIKK